MHLHNTLFVLKRQLGTAQELTDHIGHLRRGLDIPVLLHELSKATKLLIDVLMCVASAEKLARYTCQVPRTDLTDTPAHAVVIFEFSAGVVML